MSVFLFLYVWSSASRDLICDFVLSCPVFVCPVAMFVGSGVRSPGEFDVLVHLPFKVNPSFVLFVGISLFVWWPLHSPYWGASHSP